MAMMIVEAVSAATAQMRIICDRCQLGIGILSVPPTEIVVHEQMLALCLECVETRDPAPAR